MRAYLKAGRATPDIRVIGLIVDKKKLCDGLEKKAFERGSAAGFAGGTSGVNPYPGKLTHILRNQWIAGWRHGRKLKRALEAEAVKTVRITKGLS